MTNPNFKQVLVLSDRKAQLALLHKGLTALGVTSGFYYGGLKPAQLADAETKQVNNKHIIVVT